MTDKKITFLDLFAGGGGLSEGFVNAGYMPIAHVEMDQDACNTLKTRTSYHNLKNNGLTAEYSKYLLGTINREQLYALIPPNILNSIICKKMQEESMDEIYKLIEESMQNANVSKIDLILGGPPCQAYSQVGRSRKSMEGDPRNNLYKLYIKMLKRYQPEMFVFENVPGLLTAGQGKYLNNIKASFNDEGYEIEIQTQNASDFGVLQNRKRLIIIGWKFNTRHKYPVFSKVKNDYKVCDIFDDLPSIQAGDEGKNYKSSTFSKYLKDNSLRSVDDVLTWHIARNHIERDKEIYKIAISAWNKNHKRLKYTDLPEKLCTHKNKNCFLDRFKVVAADFPSSHTIMAHISKDGHYYIHPYINQARSISVREAARIQSFQDNFFFEGSRTSVFVQIGNAVPPLMANGIATALYEQFMEGKDND